MSHDDDSHDDNDDNDDDGGKVGLHAGDHHGDTPAGGDTAGEQRPWGHCPGAGDVVFLTYTTSFMHSFQGNFLDTYRNLTYKSVMGHLWVT